MGINPFKVMESLQSTTNKVKDFSLSDDGVIGDLLEELKLELSDDELITRKKAWEKAWEKETENLSLQQKENYNYWIGDQVNKKNIDASDDTTVDNRIFMAVETLLPIATRENPEPTIDTDESESSQLVAENYKKHLVHLADTERLKLVIKSVTRHWLLYRFGIAQVGWDEEKDDVTIDVILPTDIILDPDSTVKNGVTYTGEYIGRKKKATASELKDRFPKQQELIDSIVNKKTGTKLQYIEWWTKEFVFWTLGNNVLGKMKNPHWDYGSTETSVNEFGEEFTYETNGVNHFNTPQIPFIVLSIFNTGIRPYDDTSLIEQTKCIQDIVNKRYRQIDKNIDSVNGVNVFNSDFSVSQATQANYVLRKGGALVLPTKDLSSFQQITGQGLPADVYENLSDSRNEIDNVFGTHSTTRGERGSSETARGRILLKGSDESRIGGGITEYLEQFADLVFNWWVQLMFVYYTDQHHVSVLGEELAEKHENADIKQLAKSRKLRISVREGSLVPKDELTQRNEAMDLWSAGAISIIDLYKALKHPNPKDAAQRWVLQQQQQYDLLIDEDRPQADIGQNMDLEEEPTNDQMIEQDLNQQLNELTP